MDIFDINQTNLHPLEKQEVAEAMLERCNPKLRVPQQLHLAYLPKEWFLWGKHGGDSCLLGCWSIQQ